MQLTPRARFMENTQWAAAHRDLVVSTQFRAACETALAQMVLDMANSQNISEAAAVAYKLEGATQFINTLLNLAETPKPVARRQSIDNLNNNA